MEFLNANLLKLVKISTEDIPRYMENLLSVRVGSMVNEPLLLLEINAPVIVFMF